VTDVGLARTADFKAAGDAIYVIGGTSLGLAGSELLSFERNFPNEDKVGEPNWEEAVKTYSWLGGAVGKAQGRLRSLHDVSEGGFLVCVAEGLIARGLGAQITLPQDAEPWEFSYGEGFHTLVASCADTDAIALELEWSTLGIPYYRAGTVTLQDKLEVNWGRPNPFTQKIGAPHQ
jgi:phosphoribosylformylglycinamidine synthase